MRRLREQTDSTDEATARAAALLSAAAPLDGDRLRRRPLPPIEPAVRRMTPALRMTLVLAISLGSVVAAAATTLHRAPWWTFPSTGPSSSASPAIAPAPEKARPGAAVMPPAADLPAPPVASIASGAVESIGHPPAAPPPEPASDGPASAAVSRASPGGFPRTGSGEALRSGNDGESALMINAVRALRRDRDPARALALSEQALQRYPHGAQVEEALALGMEAASTAGDVTTARSLAQRYLVSFRGGRFADRAQRIVSAPAR